MFSLQQESKTETNMRCFDFINILGMSIGLSTIIIMIFIIFKSFPDGIITLDFNNYNEMYLELVLSIIGFFCMINLIISNIKIMIMRD